MSKNVTAPMVTATQYMTTPDVRTKKVSNPNGAVNVDGVILVEGTITAKSAHVQGNLVVDGQVLSQQGNNPLNAAQARQVQAYQIRNLASQYEYQLPLATQQNNGDENLYANKIANFSKGLRHNNIGEVNLSDYNAFLQAVADPTKFDLVPLQTTGKWTNPLAGVDFVLEGPDAWALAVPPAPTFSSARQAAEMVEDYWMALLRDVNFSDYSISPMSTNACADLNNLSDFGGPKLGGLVTPATLFRGNLPGCLEGPYISQFFYKTCPFGANYVEQKAQVPVPNVDFMQDYASFLNIQNGQAPLNQITFDPQLRYIRNGRDMAQWVHMDVLFQAYFQAALILMHLGCPLNPGNPYRTGHSNQIPFGSFGPPEIMASLCNGANSVLKAQWYQKWYIHRRIRPEEFAGRVDVHKRNAATYPIHSDLLNSAVLPAIHTYNSNQSYLLPQVFPEGCPTHPSYGAGHASVAGFCCTWLKAMFDTDNFNIPSPVQPTADGLNLLPYVGTLNATGEINKMAANVGLGRNMAGVHWRSDDEQSFLFGEEFAIKMLRDRKLSYNVAENYSGFVLTKFDGTKITI